MKSRINSGTFAAVQFGVVLFSHWYTNISRLRETVLLSKMWNFVRRVHERL